MPNQLAMQVAWVFVGMVSSLLLLDEYDVKGMDVMCH
jgi:hypothetical protein